MQKTKGRMNFWSQRASEIIQKNVFPLNDYIEASLLRQFHKTMQHLEEQGIVRLLFPKVNEILHVECLYPVAWQRSFLIALSA